MKLNLIIILVFVSISKLFSQSYSLLSNPNLKVWLRADTLITLNPDSTIVSWRNITSTTTFTPVNTTQAPCLKHNVNYLNDKPYFYFNGINNGLISQSVINLKNNSTTAFLVFKLLNPSFFGHVLCYGTNANGDWNLREVNNTGKLSFIHANLNLGAGTDNVNGSEPAGTTSALYLSNNFFIISAEVDPVTGQWDISENFNSKHSVNYNFSQKPENFLTIGYRSDAGLYSNFNLAEVLLFDSIINPQQTADLKQYLQTRYSQQVTIGPDINIVNNLCDTTITASPQFSSYSWSNGQTTQSININLSGKYWVDAIDIYNLSSSDTINVSYPKYEFKDSVFCKGNTIQWNTNLPTNQFTFQWQDNSTDSVLNISEAGNYYVKITDSFGCSITSDTAKITVDNFSEIASLGPDVSLCAGNSIYLTNGNSPSLTYTWSTGSNNDSLLINSSGQYSVAVTNTNNCVARDTINVTITGQAPTANFNTGNGCQNNAVSFTNLSSPPSGNSITASYWDFGDLMSTTSNTSTATNPFHTFSDTGTYSVRLNVVTDAGCEQAITKTIHIAPTPTVNFSIGNSCQNAITSFTNLSTSYPGYPNTSLKWNFGDPGSGSSNTSSINNPTHIFSNPSTYTIKLVVTNSAGCKDSLINIIAVKAEVKADFTYSTPCTNTVTVFQDNSIASSTSSSTRFWNFGNSTSNGLTVSKTYTASGPYNVSLTVSVNGCTSSISKIITIFSPPLVDFTIPTFCSKDTITFVNSSIPQSGIVSSYNWRLNNNTFSSVQNPTLSITGAGNYPVRLTVVNSFGCRDSLTKTVTVNPLPIVDFSTIPTDYYYINEPIIFIPSITTATSYSWSVSGVMTSSLQTPSVSINADGTYTASLNLQDQQGCKNSKTKIILVSKRLLDLALLNITTIKDDDGFMAVVADIANYGTVPATTINIQYQISDGGNNIETWAGILNPNSFFTYTFNSKSASQSNSTNNITCVSIKKVNGVEDENQNNNDLCSSLYYDEVSVSNPFPNPTSENLTLPIILNKDIDFTISLYNSTGQVLHEETTQKGLMGLNLINIPTSSYAWGCYIIKVVIDDKLFIKKFIKVNN